MAELQDLIRSNISRLVPYSSARDEYSGTGAVLLDANENPYNQPLNRYPDPNQRALKSRISSIYGPSEDEIFIGNGSDEAIDLLFRVFCTPGRDRCISIDPSYGMYKVCADINDVAVDMVALREDFSLDADRILESATSYTKLVFLCSPNNPSSNLLDESEIIKLLEGFHGIVVVDEAYIDFAGSQGLLHLLGRFPKLVILRTLSKAWGAAGIRLGMAFADPFIIRMMSKVKYPYNVNMLTLEKALHLLDNEAQKIEWVDRILDERARLIGDLGSYGMVREILPSDANFLMIRVENPDELYEFLVSGGVIVRNRSKLVHCEGCLRVTVGTRDENNQLLELLKQYQNA